MRMNLSFVCLLSTLVLAATAFAVPVNDGLIIHLQADALSLNDGDPVTAWPDSAAADSVNGTVTQAPGQTAPIFVKNAYNEMPAVRFTNDILSTPSQFSLPNPGNGVTIFAFFSGDASGDKSHRMAQISDVNGDPGEVVGLDASTNTSDDDGGSGFRFNNGRALAKIANPVTPGYHLGVWKMAQGATHQTASFWVDGFPRTLESTNNPTNTTTLPTSGNILSVGNGIVSGDWVAGDYYTGNLAEILVYNQQLSSQQIEQISHYLHEKYEPDGPLNDGLIIHLKADSLSLNDGDPVTAWPDAAAADSVDGSVSAVSGYGVPTFRTNALNALPAVRFTRPADPASAANSQKHVLSSSTWSWNQNEGVTVFLVCTGGMDGDSNEVQRIVQIGKSDGEVYKSFGCDVNSSQTKTDASGSGVRFNNGWCCTATEGTNPVKRGVWHVSSRQIAQGGAYGSVYYLVNDKALVRTTTNQPNRDINFDAAGNTISLGNGSLSGDWTPFDWYDGDLAEVLVYNKQLTPAMIRKVRDYLNEKYQVYSADPDENFTVVAIPDTQGYPNHSNQPASTILFREEMQFIVDKANGMNIRFASHEGDVVMVSNETQYDRALTAMDRLLNSIPFGMVPGNHDYDDGSPCEGATLWNGHFGADKDFFRDKSWFGGVLLNDLDTSGMTTYQTFSSDGIDFLHIALELEPCNQVLDWAQTIVDQYPGWPTIVTTHSYIKCQDGAYTAATRRDPLPRNNAQAVWDKFISVNPQIFMVLCGHSFDGDYHCSWRRDDVNAAGYPVHQLLADYQGCNSGVDLGNGGGWIRLMDFSPKTNTVRVRTYSTILNKYSSDPSLTDGSTYARNWAAFNYDNQGTGSLYPESHVRSSEYTIPFIYGRQLPRPAQAFGQHIAALTKSIPLDAAVEWLPGGLAFDPTQKVNGNYDRLYFVNRIADGNQGLYAASIAQETVSSQLALTTLDNPYGCALDANGNAYVCYNATPAVWKVTDPLGTAAVTQMIGNYRNTGDDDIQSIMMAPNGFGPGVDPAIDLIMIDSGLDANDNEAVVALDSTSTAASPAYTVIWQDSSDYFTSDLKGAAGERDGYCYFVPTTIPTASLSGSVRPYINRIRADGVLQRIFLNTDITCGGASPVCDDSITVNPANGSVWLATAASTSQGLIYPRTLWRIDAINAVPQGGNDFLATTTAEITSLWYIIGINGLAWSPDGKYLAIGCVDTDQLYIYTAAVPADCADAIQQGYALANDFNHDCRVNLFDFTHIDFHDLAVFLESWLNCMDPQTCDWLWP